MYDGLVLGVFLGSVDDTCCTVHPARQLRSKQRRSAERTAGVKKAKVIAMVGI